jgi:hypothetical protein
MTTRDPPPGWRWPSRYRDHDHASDTQPSASAYAAVTDYGPGTVIRLTAFPDIEIVVSEVLR